MKMTMDEALGALEAVKAIYYEKNEDGSLKERVVPFGMKYRLIKIKEALEKETALFNPERESLIRKHGEEIEQDGQMLLKVKDAEMQDYIKEINDILLTQLEVEFPKLTAQDVEKLEEKEIDINEMYMRLLTTYVFA